MSAWLKKLLAAPVFEGEEDKTRVAGMLNTILLVLLAVATVLPVTSHFAIKPDVYVLLTGAIMALGSFGLLALLRRGSVRLVGMLLTSLFFLLVTFSVYRGVRDLTITGYFFVIILAGLLLGGRGVIAYTLACVLATLAIYYVEVSGLMVFAPIEDSPSSFEVLALVVLFGLVALLLRSAVRSIDEGFSRARRNAQALQKSNRELEASRDELGVRTRQLERRARYLEATAAVARDAGAVLDMQELLSRVVTLIGERFEFYHVGIFLVGPSRIWAELKAASSKEGQRMVARGHRVRVGGEGIMGYVTGRGEYRIALDVGKDAVYFDSPDLPETRSEIALPLQARGEIIGALDVQSTEPEAFSEEDVAVLQTLTDQVAMAISNARLFERAQEALEAERRAYGETGRRAWADLLRTSAPGYRYDEGGVTRLAGDEKPVTFTDDLPKRVLPIKAHEAVIGRITVHKPVAVGDWTADEAAALETLVEQLGIALEGAQLYQETQRRAARERVIREVSDQVQRATSMDSLMRITAEELNKALGGLRAYMRLGTEEVLSLREE